MENTDLMYREEQILKKILEKTPVDWDAFDEALCRLQDINAYDEWVEDTILSNLLKGTCFEHGENICEIIKRFLKHGYDVNANEGRNGCYALVGLCYSSYDWHILEGAKLLLANGSPTNCPSDEDDYYDDYVLYYIEWKVSGAWFEGDFLFADVLEAYHEMIEAYRKGKNFQSIGSLYDCIGKQVTDITVSGANTVHTLQAENTVADFENNLVIWFGDKPLVIDCFNAITVNPIIVSENDNEKTDVPFLLNLLKGSRLKQIEYPESSICFFEFDNGYRLIFSNILYIETRKAVCEIRRIEEETMPGGKKTEAVCFSDSIHFSEPGEEYTGRVLAVFDDTNVYFIYGGDGVHLLRCSKGMAREYSQMLPLRNITDIKVYRKNKKVSGIRLACDNYFLYIVGNSLWGLEVRLCEEKFNPNNKESLSCAKGMNMKFGTYAVE